VLLVDDLTIFDDVKIELSMLDTEDAAATVGSPHRD